MRLVFLGSGEFGVPTLRSLLAEHEVALVVTQPDKPAGRGGKLRPTPVGAVAAEAGATTIKPERVNAPEVIDQIRGINADAWVVIAYGQKLGRALLDGVFAVNLHASLLPRWRGAAPIHHAVMAGDSETGNSVITLADEMDAGDVLGTSRRKIGPTQTTGELHDLLADDGPDLMRDVLARHTEGNTQRTVQDPEQVTLATKLSRADAAVDFTADASACRARINGLSPWPGCASAIGGGRVKLVRAGPAEGSGQPGTLLDADSGIVACGTGAIRILEVQPEGKKPMAFDAFARGRRLETGAAFEPMITQ